MGLWGMIWFKPLAFAPLGGWPVWHAHEMVFGFAGAFVAGFLLTASQNWTGLPGLSGVRLLALFLVWLIARLAWLFGGPWWLAAGFDSGFYLVSAIALASLLWQAKNARNYFFVGLLLILGFTAFTSALGTQSNWQLISISHRSAFWCIALVAFVMGARVIPFFSERKLQYQRFNHGKFWQPLAILSLVVFVFLDLLTIRGWVSSLVGSLSALCFLVMAISWKPWRTLPEPMLWSLHLAYGFLVLGLVVCAWLPGNKDAFHLLAVGGLGLLILAMISRVSLGHTGRGIQASPWVVMAFLCLIIAALIRGLWPLLLGGNHLSIYSISILFWLLGFGIFMIQYWPVLTQPRADR